MGLLSDFQVTKLNYLSQKWSVRLGDILRNKEPKFVVITVAAGATSGSSAADTTLVGGTVIAAVSAGNQDQTIKNVAISGTGVVTVTLNAAATAINTIRVTVQKA